MSSTPATETFPIKKQIPFQEHKIKTRTYPFKARRKKITKSERVIGARFFLQKKASNVKREIMGIARKKGKLPVKDEIREKDESGQAIVVDN